jgi:hypothetical protein
MIVAGCAPAAGRKGIRNGGWPISALRRVLISLTVTLLLIVSVGTGIAVATWPHWRHWLR